MKTPHGIRLRVVISVAVALCFLLAAGPLNILLAGTEGQKETGEMKVERDVLAEAKRK